MKKLFALILTTALVLGVFSVPASIFAEASEDGMLSLLSELNIMKGDPDGNMRLDDRVSRAEFTKVAVASSMYKNSVATSLKLSPFPDVTYQHWAAPYVRVAVTNGLANGYPDGTFAPENTVLYEEAVTMLLRVLGYTNGDFGYSWPTGQMGLAANIDLTKGVNCNVGDEITRRDVAKLVFNALKTKMKNQSTALITAHESNIAENVTLIASNREDSSIASDEIFTSNGTFKTENNFVKDSIGMKGDLVTNKNNRVIAFVPDISANSATDYIVYSVVNDKVMAYKDGVVRQLDISDDTAAYKGKTPMTYLQLKSQLSLGDKIKVTMSDNGEIDYITYSEGNVSGPVTSISGSWKSGTDVPDGCKVTRNGVDANEASIADYDVVYYLKDLNMVLAYSDKVSGIYETAIPNRDSVTAVTVSGKTYELEGSAAFNKLRSGGSFEYGDTVTLLLGKDGKVADVISPSASARGVVGYLIKSGTKDYLSGNTNTYTNYYITVVGTDGAEYEYITDRDYSENLNSIVSLSFRNGNARITTVNSQNTVSGVFDWNAKKLGKTPISSNIQILDISTRNVTDMGSYAKVYGQRLDDVNISAKNILYCERNSSGEITSMILNDVTGDAFEYGIITSTSISGNMSGYGFMSNGNRYTASSINGSYGVKQGDVVKIGGNLMKPDSFTTLSAVNGTITSFTADSIVAGNKVYKVSDKVQVYKTDSDSYLTSSYSMISLDELLNNKAKYNIRACYDKPSDSGGRVRVILVTLK